MTGIPQAPAAGASVLDLARAMCRDLPLYLPTDAPVAIDLTDNTNLWGSPPAAQRVIRGTAGVMRYPSTYAFELKEALAGYLEVERDMIATGCGSDQILDCAIRAFAGPGDRLAHPDPSFVMIPVFARLNGLTPVGVPLAADGGVDPDALLATGARIIYLCSPNNPTGGTMSRDAIAHVVERAPGLVIVDEAYAEFAGWDARELVRASDRVLLARTLSKAWGMAGLRVGYGVGAPALIGQIERARGPYTVSAIAERAAAAAVREDVAWMRDRVTDAIASRERFADTLRGLGLDPLPSQANFVFVPVPDAPAVARRMAEHGVGVRAWRGLATFGDAMRITVGPDAVMTPTVAALRAALIDSARATVAGEGR